MSPSRVYSTKASRPSSLTAKRPRSRSWPIPLPSTQRSPVFVSAIIALSLVVAALRAYAALGRLQPALGGVQFGRLHRGQLGSASRRERVCQYVWISVVSALSQQKYQSSNYSTARNINSILHIYITN